MQINICLQSYIYKLRQEFKNTKININKDAILNSVFSHSFESRVLSIFI